MAKKISGSVGPGGRNNAGDVRIVQQLLNANIGKIVPLRPLIENGLAHDATIGAIEEFQRRVVGMPRPTGRVDPGDKTMIKLNQNNGAKKTHQLSLKGASLLKGIEELRLKPYDDQTGKEVTAWVEGATIGYGHLISKGEWETYKNGITEAQANTLFNSDVAPFAQTVNTKVSVELTQHQFDALVIFAFNIGRKGFADSSALKLVNDPNAKTSYKDLESAWKAWNKSQGKVMKGLNNRRNAEWNIYSKNVYKSW